VLIKVLSEPLVACCFFIFAWSDLAIVLDSLELLELLWTPGFAWLGTWLRLDDLL